MQIERGWFTDGRSSLTERQARETEGPILVVGAAGFIGSHLCRRLALVENRHVIALVHRANTTGAARLARIPVKIVQGDATHEDLICRVAKGCGAIVNCVSGSHDTILEATENVMQAGVVQKIPRVIHFSSTVVQGRAPHERQITEDSPFYNDGDEYCSAKIKAERIVAKYVKEEKVATTVLRPTIVYGPYCRNWTDYPVSQIRKKSKILIGRGSGVANVAYVSNVVDATVLSLTNENAIGQTFIVNDDEVITWKDFYEAYCNMFIPRRSPEELFIHSGAGLQVPQTSTESFLNLPRWVAHDIASSGLLSQAKKLPSIRYVWGLTPDFLRRMLVSRVHGSSERKTKLRTHYGAPSGVTQPKLDRKSVTLQSNIARFSNEKLKRVLGWRQRVPFAKGMALTEEYLRHFHMIP